MAHHAAISVSLIIWFASQRPIGNLFAQYCTQASAPARISVPAETMRSVSTLQPRNNQTDGPDMQRDQTATPRSGVLLHGITAALTGCNGCRILKAVNATGKTQMISRKFDIAAFALLLSLVSAQVLAKPPQAGAPGNNVVVAKVGEKAITREDIIHTILIEKFYKSPALSEADALVIVMQDAIAQEVALSVGVVVTPSETPVNFPFVNEFTPSGAEDFKAQETLPPQEQAFHVSHAAYAQLYVVPKIIDRKLRRYYNTSSFLHSSERALIKQALQLVISGKSFEEAANATGLMTARRELENNTIKMPAALIPILPVDSHLPKIDTLFDILNQLTPGAVHPAIIEDGVGYRVLRLIARNGQKYTIETIEAAKPPFESWLKERASTLHISINDDALKRDVKRDYPGIDWVGRL